MENQPKPVLARLLNLAAQYSGRQAQPGNRAYQDLGLNGGDFIEFVGEVEREFGVDLAWVSPRQAGAKAQDPTLESIAEYICHQQS